MSSSHNEQPINVTSQILSSKDIKTIAYKLLKQNQSQLWKHFVIAIIKHIQYSTQNRKNLDGMGQDWVKQEIQRIFHWISDPKQRIYRDKYMKYKSKWEKQVKQWENTFEKVLTTQIQMRKLYEAQIAKIKYQLQQIKDQNIQLSGRNEVLESANKIMLQKIRNINTHNCEKIKENEKVKHQKVIDNHLKIVSQQIAFKCQPIPINEQYQSCKYVVNEGAIQKIQFGSMTCEILSTLLSQCQQPNKIFKQQCAQTLKISSNQKLILSPLYNIHIPSIHKQLSQASIQTQPNTNTHLESQTQTYEQNKYEQSQYRYTNHTDINQYEDHTHDENQLYSCSSQSSYIIEFDRAMQTEIIESCAQGIQTDTTKENSNTMAMTTLLLKIAQLENSIEEYNSIISNKQIQMNEIKHKLSMSNNTIHDLQQQLAISSHIETHISQQYEDLKSQYTYVQQNYKNLLTSFNSYIESVEKRQSRCFMENQSQTQPYNSFISLQSKQEPTRISTVQSEQQQQRFNTSMIDKSTVMRYFLQYIKLQVQNGSVDRKMSSILTILQVLGKCQESQLLIKRYIDKMNVNIKKSRNREYKQKVRLQQKLFKYLTEH